MNKGIYLKSLVLALTAAGCIAGLTSCTGKNGPVYEDPVFELDTSADNPVLLVSEETYVLTYHAEGISTVTLEDVPEGWQASVDGEAGRIYVTAPSATAGTADYNLKLTVTGNDGESTTVGGVSFHRVTFDGAGGTFVLNEGNMTTENGSLIYITPEGYVVDTAYRRVNGTDLGNVAQDMCFHDGKIYIISQNGDTNPEGTSFENDGMLVVADAVTLKKVRSLTKEQLPGLDWPTHIAVIDEQHVYIRDNKGVWRLNMDDVSLTFISGTEGAPKSRFAVTGGEVYFPQNGLLCALKKIDPATDQVSSVAEYAFWATPYMVNYFLGIAPADDGCLWAICTSAMDGEGGQITLNKVDPAASTVTQNLLSARPDAVYSCCMAASGNTVYYASGTMVYRAVFDPEAGEGDVTDEVLTDLFNLDGNAVQLYNGLGVNPITGHVFINTIKGFGNFFTTNSIWEFDFSSSLDIPVRRIDNLTHFPAGFYFNE